MASDADNLDRYVEAIKRSGLTIYKRIEIGHPELWIPTLELQNLLDTRLAGISLSDLPPRTRSKVAKEHICRALGYPVPPNFKKTQPRFPGQRFDTYVQKSNNLQIWNEELAPTRRYVIIRVDNSDTITKVKVVTGRDLARLDMTGTLTQKYQAQIIPGTNNKELIASTDTERLQHLVRSDTRLHSGISPNDYPMIGQLLSIRGLFERLRTLIGKKFMNTGHDQDRNRGAELHRIVCQSIGYSDYTDDGQFPDIKHQLLEVKLQTSPTIDLGLGLPSSKEILDVYNIGVQRIRIRYCDVRYALFYAHSDGSHVTLTHLFLTTGEKFFTRFRQFQGKILNKKLQIALPSDFFSD